MSAEFVTLTIVRTELDARMMQSLLETDGIVSFFRQTNFGAASDEVGRGQQEILVRPKDLERARALIGGS